MIKQFLRDVDWGKLDYLVDDTPHRTSDEHLSIVKYLKESPITAAIIVTTPQVNSQTNTNHVSQFIFVTGSGLIRCKKRNNVLSKGQFTCYRNYREYDYVCLS